jgi:hypothetical protein
LWWDFSICSRPISAATSLVRELRAAGLEAADAEKLIAFRIHGVTPEYIEGLRSKGMRDLTLDQLINLRIHGID